MNQIHKELSYLHQKPDTIEFMNESVSVKTPSKKTLSDTSISVFLFAAAGAAIGCILAYLLRNGIYSYIFHLYQTLLSQLQTLEVDRQDFFLLAARRLLKYYLLLWFFAFTNIWKYYYRLFSGYIGFQSGLLLAFCVQLNGLWGVVGFLCFLLPHSLLVIPAFLVSTRHCDRLHRQLHSITVPKHRLILCEFPYFFLSMVLLLLGCLLETCTNPALLRLYFR